MVGFLPFLSSIPALPFHTIFTNQSLCHTDFILFTSPLVILTVISPGWVPGIGYQPVWCAILSAPAKNLDSMPSEQ